MRGTISKLHLIIIRIFLKHPHPCLLPEGEGENSLCPLLRERARVRALILKLSSPD
jgi:hypothetical protein